MIHAAGILFMCKGNALFLKRSALGDHAGEWCFPGGKLEGNETPEQAALRECIEEIGTVPTGTRREHSVTIFQPPPAVDLQVPLSGAVSAGATAVPPSGPADSVTFTTYVQQVAEEFVPQLDHEHVGYAWAPVTNPPEPLHPGCAVSIAKLSMNEMDIARAMSATETPYRLISPQPYINMHLWLMRITGTGVAYRRAHKEFVFRDPALYLTQDFLDRCNGLAVVMEHPQRNTLDSDEYADRSIGSILLPFIKGDEVWGVAKIYDDLSNAMMRQHGMSTSPAVVFLDPAVNSKLQLDDGKIVLIEGEPSLLDHLAVCIAGVWDKGGKPTGVISETRKDSTMAKTEEEMKADAAKADATKADAAKADDAGSVPDKMLAALDSAMGKVKSMCDAVMGRMDGMEENFKKADAARKDAEEDEKKKADAAKADAAKKDAMDDPEKVAADRAKKDADEKEKADAAKKADAEKEEKEEKEKADAQSKADSEVRKMIADVAARLPAQLSDSDMDAMADCQSRADAVLHAHGKKAPRPLDGDTVMSYRRRMATLLKPYSKQWASIDLNAIADSAAFDNIEKSIYADATSAATAVDGVAPGQLRAVVTKDITGRNIINYYGDPSAWMGRFGAHRRKLSVIYKQTDR